MCLHDVDHVAIKKFLVTDQFMNIIYSYLLLSPVIVFVRVVDIILEVRQFTTFRAA